MESRSYHLQLKCPMCRDLTFMTIFQARFFMAINLDPSPTFPMLKKMISNFIEDVAKAGYGKIRHQVCSIRT